MAKRIQILSMKVFSSVILLLSCLNINATTYYVNAISGDDTNTGHRVDPWQSLVKVSSANLAPGDSVLFARNQSYRGNISVHKGTDAQYITYGAYGTGSKPLLLGSINRSKVSDWTSVGINLWSVSNVVTIDGDAVDAGSIIFNNEESVGWKVSDLNLLQHQGMFYSDISAKTVTMYSVGNPGSVYSKIEIALKKNIISISGKSYVNIENLDLRYTGAHGIAGSTSHHIKIRNVDMSYIGGSFQSGTTRYGNGVEFWNDAHDNLVEDCSFSQIYDAAITNQGDMTNCKQYNLYYRKNTIKTSEYSFEIWLRGEGASMNNIYFENNTCLNAGMGWGNEQRRDPNGSHLCFWGYTASVSNVFIRNNTFKKVNGAGIFVTKLEDISKSTTNIDHNKWDVSDQLAVMTGWNNEKHRPINTHYSWEYYRTKTMQDENSN